jgi:hypothetical protein
MKLEVGEHFYSNAFFTSYAQKSQALVKNLHGSIAFIYIQTLLA